MFRNERDSLFFFLFFESEKFLHTDRSKMADSRLIWIVNLDDSVHCRPRVECKGLMTQRNRPKPVIPLISGELIKSRGTGIPANRFVLAVLSGRKDTNGGTELSIVLPGSR